MRARALAARGKSAAAGEGPRALIGCSPRGPRSRAAATPGSCPDASAYEEMLRQQTITVEQAKASHLQARLNYEIALLAVQRIHGGDGPGDGPGDARRPSALAPLNLSRAEERLEWTKRHELHKGYASACPGRHRSGRSVITLGTGCSQSSNSPRMSCSSGSRSRSWRRRWQGGVKTAETNLNN